MRKILTLAIVFAGLFFEVNAQQNDLEKERMDKFSRIQTQEMATGELTATSDCSVNQNALSEKTAYNVIPSSVKAKTIITHSHSQELVAESIHCGSEGIHAENSYYRAFDLATDFGITGAWVISKVEVGVQTAIGNGGTQSVWVKLYTASSTNLATATLTPLYEEKFALADASMEVVELVLATPAVVPSGEILAVEIFTPDGGPLGNTFFIGSNNAGQNAPSYIRAPSCDVFRIIDLAAIGAPDMHIVLNLWGGNVGTPSAVTNFNINPGENGALTIDASWTNPGITFDGSPLNELTSVDLYIDAEETPLYTNATPIIGGDEVQMAIDLTEFGAGMHTFTAVGTNSMGVGNPSIITLYIGNDVPAAPTNVVLAKDDMEAQLSWVAPTVGLNGGYLNETGVTYNVLRYPGAVVVSEGQAGLTFTETLEVPGFYYYKVIASNAVGVGGNATSNELLIGNFIVYEMFDGTGLPQGWTTMGLGLDNWKTVNTNKAGGGANEVFLNWFPSFDGESHLVSSILNTSTYQSLTLNYKDMFDDYNPHSKTIGVKTTIDGGSTWLVVHEEVMANGNVNIGPRDTEVVIANEHVGNPNFQFAFFYNGSTFNFDGWYIDNVTVLGVLAAGANVTFTVKEGAEPIEGAVVEINSVEYTTDASGTVTAFVLEGTDISYTVNKFAYAEATGTITVVDGVEQDVNVELVSLPTYHVTFNVMNANSNPVNALVKFKADGVTVASGTAIGGTITFAGIPNGDYTFSVDMQGYFPVTGNITVTDADATVPDVVLVVNPYIVIGVGEVSDKPYPINAYWGHSYSQSIYLQPEIASIPMIITNVKYYFNGTSLSNSNDWTIYLGHTDKSEFESKTDWIPLSELTQVYSAEFTNPTGPGWIEFEIEDFEYNGVDNLVIAVDQNKPSDNTPSDTFLCSPVTGNRSIAVYSDSNPDPGNPPVAKVSEAFIPNTVLTAHPKPGANVTFRVMDGVNPIEGAAVSVENKTYLTLADATVTAYVGEGTAIPYTVNKFGFAEYEGTITVVSEIDQDVDITMVVLPTYSVSFNIKNILNEPLDATVTLYFDGIGFESGTAVAGEIVFTDIPVGSYTFDVDFEGYVAQTNLPLEVISTSVSKSIALVEVFNAPVNLVVNVNKDEHSAKLIWNIGDSNFADSFEDGTFDAWSKYIQGSGTPGTNGPNPYWYIKEGNAADGNKFCHSDWGYNINTSLISEDLEVTETSTLSFWWNTSYDWNVSPSNNGDLLVKISTNGGFDWIPLWKEDDVGVFDNFTWYETVLDLSEYVGTVKIAFNYISNDGATQGLDHILFTDIPRKTGTVAVSNIPNVPSNAKTAKGANYTFTKNSRALVGYNVYLDDLVTPVNAEPVAETNYLFEDLALGTYTAGVEAVYTTGVSEMVTVDFELSVVGINSRPLSNLEVYPNPFSNEINITDAERVNRVVITNIVGKRVLDITLNGKNSFNVSELTNGVYLLTFEGYNGERTVRKMIKK